jgi:hypothetical protein
VFQYPSEFQRREPHFDLDGMQTGLAG